MYGAPSSGAGLPASLVLASSRSHLPPGLERAFMPKSPDHVQGSEARQNANIVGHTHKHRLATPSMAVGAMQLATHLILKRVSVHEKSSTARTLFHGKITIHWLWISQ